MRATQRRALYNLCGAVAVQRRRRARKAAASAHAELCRQQRCVRAWRRAAWAGRRVAALAVLQAVRVQGVVLDAWRVFTVRSRCAGHCIHVHASYMLHMHLATGAHNLLQKSTLHSALCVQRSFLCGSWPESALCSEGLHLVSTSIFSTLPAHNVLHMLSELHSDNVAALCIPQGAGGRRVGARPPRAAALCAPDQAPGPCSLGAVAARTRAAACCAASCCCRPP